MMHIQQASQSSLKDFTVMGRLGSGSFGTVYKVQRKVDQQFYVLKQILLGGMDAAQQKEAIKEVQIMADLDHEYCVRYYDSFIDDGKLNIVMEYCDRGDLQRLLKSQGTKKLKEKVIWRLFIQMALGLRYLHTKRILHRDIKSANVFLCKGNRLKIGDLGVARVLSTNTHFAKTCVGTPYYLSPELCTGNPYNAKSDVWALGCVLYEMCTLKHPFDATNQGALILKIVSGKYPPVTEYSNPLRKLVSRMLTRDNKARPSISQVLMSRAVVEKAQELDISLPADILEGATKHDERVVLAAQQRAARRAAQRAAAERVESELPRRTTRRPSEGGITGMGLLPRTSSGTTSTPTNSHGNLLKGNVRGGRVRRGAPQRRPKVKQLPGEHSSSPAVKHHRRARTSSGGGAKPARSGGSPSLANGGGRVSGRHHHKHHLSAPTADVAEVAELPAVVAAAAPRSGGRRGGRRTVAQLQMAASGQIGGQPARERDDDDVGAGAALARMRLGGGDGQGDDVSDAMNAQFERDLYVPANGGGGGKESRNVVVNDAAGGLHETIIDAPEGFWEPVVPDDDVLRDVVAASAREAEAHAKQRHADARTGAGAGAGAGSRAHEVSLDVVEVSHGVGVGEDDDDNDDDFDPNNFPEDDDFEEEARFLHPGALFSVPDDQHARLADHHADSIRAHRDGGAMAGTADSAESDLSHSTSKEPEGADAAPVRTSAAAAAARTAGGGLYDAPDRIAELMDTQAQLKAQISHLRLKCGSTVDKAVIDRVCNATSRDVMEEDPVVQEALHAADPVDIYSLIKLLFCVNSLRETEAQMEALMTGY